MLYAKWYVHVHVIIIYSVSSQMHRGITSIEQSADYHCLILYTNNNLRYVHLQLCMPFYLKSCDAQTVVHALMQLVVHVVPNNWLDVALNSWKKIFVIMYNFFWFFVHKVIFLCFMVTKIWCILLKLKNLGIFAYGKKY